MVMSFTCRNPARTFVDHFIMYFRFCYIAVKYPSVSLGRQCSSRRQKNVTIIQFIANKCPCIISRTSIIIAEYV